RSSNASYRSSTEGESDESESITSRARSTPRTSASSNSASSRGLSTLAAASAIVPSAIASRTRTAEAVSGHGPLLPAQTPLVGLERGGQLIELAHQDPVEVVDEQVDAVVLDALFLEVVGADLLRALAGADLGLARRRDRGLLLGQGPLIQTRAQDPHRALTV